MYMQTENTKNTSNLLLDKAGDEIISAISLDGFVSISAITSKQICERARIIHNSSPVVTAALGRTLSAASIIGSTLKKEGASLTVRINGGGPAGSIIVVSDSEGNVRGYVQNPTANIPNKQNGKLDVGGIVGKEGMLSLIKDFGGSEPYIGSVELVSGEIAEDFAAYFFKSEQSPTVCALGVLINTDRTVLASGGYVVRLLPDAPEEIIEKVDKNINDAGPVTELLREGGIQTLLETVMKGFSPRILERRGVEYRCFCTRERIKAALSALDRSEQAEIIEKGETIEVTCQFCDDIFHFHPSELFE